MNGREELNARILAWLQQRQMSPHRLGILSGVKPSTLQRILDDPGYKSSPGKWRQLARYLEWDEAEVLGLAGFGPLPSAPATDPVEVIVQQIRRVPNLTEAERNALLIVVRQFAERAALREEASELSRNAAP